MMIQFVNPEFFFLLPLLALVAWKLPNFRLLSPLRLVLTLVLILALTHPILNKGGAQLDLWLLVDRSDSTNGLGASHWSEIHSILESHKKKDDRIRVVDFAQNAVLRQDLNTMFESPTSSTNMEEALNFTLANVDPTRSNRILMLTDGYPTGPLKKSVAGLQEAKISVDYRLLTTRNEQDVAISDVRIPSRIRPGESYILEVSLSGPAGLSTSVPWTISRNGGEPLKGTAQLHKGKGKIRLTDRIENTGSAVYEVIISPSDDPIVGNNRAVCYTESGAGNTVLLLSGYENDPLVPIIQSQGFKVLQPVEPMALSAADLSDVGSVIINNLSASKLSSDFLRSLKYYVNEQGGGLLMCGGRHSFGAGGYFSSAIDDLLPVSMELKKDKIHMLVAMSMVMDRSGSMACSTGGGLTKMDLANSGVCRTIDLLTDEDFLSVTVVDTQPHEIVTMSPIGENRERMKRSISHIESMGGGIYVKEGLEAGWKELQKATVGTRHMILFADADDSEEPGDYEKFLEKLTAEGVTLSVIALGSTASADAQLLEQLAELGGGRIFFCERDSEIPQVFAQETMSVARSLFIKEPTPLQETMGWLQIAASSPQWPKHIDGYNLSYLKDGATAACLSGDDYNAPLLAFWNRGAGRCAAITFPMAGEYSQTVRQWAEYGDMMQTLVRWLNRPLPPEGYSVRTEIQGNLLNVLLYYSDANIPQMAKQMPTLSLELSSKQSDEIVHGSWELLKPGVYQYSYQLEPNTLARGAVHIGKHVLPFGPLTLQTNPEWNFSDDVKAQFLDLVQKTGGQERLDLISIFDAPRNQSSLDLQVYLIWSGLLLLVVEALLSKIGLLPRKKVA